MMARSAADLISDATGRLSAVTPTPALDAELLLCAACGLTRTKLAVRHNLELTAKQLSHLSDLIDRRATGEPVAYLLGHKEFWSLDLAVNTSTLIPRPETEQLVEQVLALVPPDSPCRIADLGTGSGAVALAVASERPLVHVTATDISQVGLRVAAANAFKCADWFESLVESGFRLIVSNPPYVRSHDPLLEAGTHYEPREALFAGDDGLQAFRSICADAADHLEPTGILVLEHSHDQGPALHALLSAAGFSSIVTRVDGAGLPRVTLGRLARKT